MIEYVPYFVFVIYLGLITVGASIAVFSSNMVRALVGLVCTMLGVAGAYLLMQAPFLAMMQLLIYVGAICIIIFFAIMLSKPGEEVGQFRIRKLLTALGATIAVVVTLAPALFTQSIALRHTPVQVPIATLGSVLLDEYLLSFELISIILLVSMAGAVLLARDRRKQ